MKAYTYVSPSHNYFLDNWLKPTLPGSIDLHVEKVSNQICPSGTFKLEGWKEFNIERSKFFIDVLKSSAEPVLFLDCDIQFFRDPVEIINQYLKTYDIVAQDDTCIENRYFQYFCCGFMCVNPIKETIRLWEDICNVCEHPNEDHRWSNDQEVLNEIIFDYNIKPGTLPLDCVWSTRSLKVSKLSVPPNIFVHHANWCIGIDKKIQLMKNVREIWKNNYQE